MAQLPKTIEDVRRFSRFYTRRLGLLGRYLDTGMSLTEARLRFELAQVDTIEAGALADRLGIDRGQLTRLIARLVTTGDVERAVSQQDGRRVLLGLTDAGRTAFMALEAASRGSVERLVSGLLPAQRAALSDALATVEHVLGAAQADIRIRRHEPGDIGTIVGAQARVYALEYGWSVAFEAAVAEIGAAFLRSHDPTRERAFIATLDNRVVGSVFCIDDGLTDAGEPRAKLRMLYVDAAVRGQGLGRRLVRECMTFAADAGYREMVLWTNDVLTAARDIYRTEGFKLVHTYSHHSFGKDLIGEIWSRPLTLAKP